MSQQKFVLSLLFCVFSFGNEVFGQKQDYLDSMAIQSCKCSENLTEDNLNIMQIGLCMMQSASPYSKELERDYNIKMTEVATQGEALGKIIGMRMLTHCPDMLVKMAEMSKGMEESDEELNNELVVEGTITKVEKEQFIFFTIKEENTGMNRKYYWLSFIETPLNLETEYQKLSGAKVEIGYQEWELFDAKLGEYRAYNVITYLEKK